MLEQNISIFYSVTEKKKQQQEASSQYAKFRLEYKKKPKSCSPYKLSAKVKLSSLNMGGKKEPGHLKR